MAESNDVKTFFFKKEKEVSIVRKPRLPRKAAIPDGSNEGSGTNPRPFDKPLLTRFAAIAGLETPKPINREKTVRRARKGVSETYRPDRAVVDRDSTPHKRTVTEDRIRFGTYARAPGLEDAKTESSLEDRAIDVSRLKQLAVQKLPKDSVLRKVILLEEGPLTAQEFCDRIRIWLCLLDHGG